jgi:type IV secretory pathway protease TraF
LEITRGQTAGLGFFNVQDVYKPTRTGSAIVVDAPKDMVGWLQQHPYLQTSKPEPVRVGGVKGVEFDVGVGELPRGYNLTTCSSITGAPNCVDLVRLSTGRSLFAAEGYPGRVIVLEDLEGETVTIGVFSPASEFEEFVPEAQKVIDTVKWTGS